MKYIGNVIERDIMHDRFLARMDLHLKSYDMRDLILRVEGDAYDNYTATCPDGLASCVLDLHAGTYKVSLIIGINGKELNVYSEDIEILI